MSAPRKPRVTSAALAGLDVADRRRTVVPPEFADYAATRCNDDVADKFGISLRTVNRWREIVGVPSPNLQVGGVANKLAIPEDFAERAATMTRAQLAAHYGFSHSTVCKFVHVTGATPVKADTPKGRPKLARPAEYRLCRYTNRTPAPRINSHADAAARELQRLGEVIRCDEHRRYDPKGKFFRVWGSLCTPDEVVDLARRRCGFDPDAWRQLGAAA